MYIYKTSALEEVVERDTSVDHLLLRPRRPSTDDTTSVPTKISGLHDEGSSTETGYCNEKGVSPNESRRTFVVKSHSR